MRTLLLDLKAPLQSWGTGSAYRRHDTADHPTRSGITGLIASALGRPRDADNTDISRLRYGCLTIRPGRHVTDLQTMGRRRDGRPNPLQTRQYLMDARFLIGLEAEDDDPLPDRIADAIKHPTHPPYLGRRGCPPAGPIPVHITDQPLEQALAGDGDTWIEPHDPNTIDPDRLIVRWDRPNGFRRFASHVETLLDPFLDFAQGDPS